MLVGKPYEFPQPGMEEIRLFLSIESGMDFAVEGVIEVVKDFQNSSPFGGVSSYRFWNRIDGIGDRFAHDIFADVT